jgi:prevent-host-death family protein
MVMPTITVHEAKTNLSELLRRVEAGEEIIIARGDKPVAVLRSYNAEDITRRRKASLGMYEGKYPPASDEALFGPMTDEDLLEMFGEDYVRLFDATAKVAR